MPKSLFSLADVRLPLSQIWMSVLRNPIRVMKTLIAPTVKVLTSVHVKKVLMEMVQSAKVNKTVVL